MTSFEEKENGLLTDCMEIEVPCLVSRPMSDYYGVFGDNSKIKKLGWKPQYTVAAGMREMVGWALAANMKEK